MSTLRSAGGKGSLYTDASWRTAAIRKNAILNGQTQKCGAGPTIISQTFNTISTGPGVYNFSIPYEPFIGNFGDFQQALGAADSVQYDAAKSQFLLLGGLFPTSQTTAGASGIPGGVISLNITGNYVVDLATYISFSSIISSAVLLANSTLTFSHGSTIGCSVLSGANALKKPLVGEYHLQKGFTAGVTELILAKNKNGFI